MKQGLIVLFLILGFAVFSTIGQSVKATDNISSQLVSLRDEIKKFELEKHEKVRKVFSFLDKAVEQANNDKKLSEKDRQKLIDDIIFLAGFAGMNDNSLSCGAVLLPLIKKHKNEVESAIKKLSYGTAYHLREMIKESQKEEVEGNG